MVCRSKTLRGSARRRTAWWPRRLSLALTLLVSPLFPAPTQAQHADPDRRESIGGPWLTEQAGFEPDLTYPILYTLTLHGGALLFLASLEKNTTGFSSPSVENFADAFTKGPPGR